MAYFIHERGAQAGPFTVEELKQKGILPSTAVWAVGLAEWTTASRLKELDCLFAPAPPPFTQPNGTTRPTRSIQQPKRTGSVVENFLRVVGAAVLIVLVALFLTNQFSHPVRSGYGSLNAPAMDLEH